MSNFNSVLVTLLISTFSFACSGSTERTFPQDNDAETIKSETAVENDSGITPETSSDKDTGNIDTGNNTAVDSGPLKNESGALIVDGKCVPKTKNQIEQDYTASMNTKFTSDGFGDYDQFIGCGVHDDGCGGTVDSGDDVCPADPQYLPNNGKIVAGKDIVTANTILNSANSDAGTVKRLACDKSGFCLGTCRIAKVESLSKMFSQFPLSIDPNSSYAFFTGKGSDGYNYSNCKIIPKFVIDANSCAWYTRSTMIGNYMTCGKY